MIPIYQGRRRQRGYGVGGNFASFFRAAAPFLKSAGLTVGKEALRAGDEILDDLEKGGKNLQDIFKTHGKRTAKSMLEPLIQQGAKFATEKIKDIFSEEEAIKPSTKKRKTSHAVSQDIFNE